MHSDIINRLTQVIESRKAANSADSYVASLFGKGRAKIAEKVGEEAIETVIAAMGDDRAHLTSEAADLLFHLMILLSDAGLGLEDVLAELDRREGLSGHEEKAARKS